MAVGPRPVRVLTLNLEYGAEGYPLARAVAVAEQADVVLLSETETNDGRDAGKELAKRLQWHHVGSPRLATAVISRWPLDAVAGAKHPTALVRPPGRPTFYAVSVHLSDYPYQPFQAARIRYCYGVAANAPCQPARVKPETLAQAAKRARGGEIASLLRDTRGLRRPVVVGGDFNEPSHLDWTPRAARAGYCPVSVPFPASRAMRKAGFIDAFRIVFPDEVAHRGNTWPAQPQPGRPDRIDFIYVRDGRVQNARMVDGFPSDHRPVLVAFAPARLVRGGSRVILAGRVMIPILLAVAAVLLLVVFRSLLFAKKSVRPITIRSTLPTPAKTLSDTSQAARQHSPSPQDGQSIR
jgi:endonuclease/exonuclease/phosphatase (EEP) superfamily protein YafD